MSTSKKIVVVVVDHTEIVLFRTLSEGRWKWSLALTSAP